MLGCKRAFRSYNYGVSNFIFRTHTEQLSESNRDGQFRLEAIERKISEMGLQVQVQNFRIMFSLGAKTFAPPLIFCPSGAE